MPLFYELFLLLREEVGNEVLSILGLSNANSGGRSSLGVWVFHARIENLQPPLWLDNLEKIFSEEKI